MSSTIETLRTILQSAPGNWFIRMLLVEALMEKEGEQKAREALQVDAGLPYDKQFLIYAARAHGAVSPDLGLDVAHEATERFPKFAQAYFEKGNFLVLLGNREEADQAYKSASQLDPNQKNPLTSQVMVEAHPEHNGTAISLLNSIVVNREQLAVNRKKQKANESVASIGVACMVLVVVCVGLLLVPAPFSAPRPLQIMATTIPDNEVKKPVPPKNQKLVEEDRPVQTTSSMAMNLVTAANTTALSVVSFDTPSTDFGISSTGLEFGTSMNFGGGGGKSTVMFFGSKSVGKRFLFILDASPSMTKDQIRLRDKELKKTIETLGKASYHVILFGGGAHFVEDGWGPSKSDGFYAFESPSGPYNFIPSDTGFTLAEPEIFKPPKWLKPGEKQITATLRQVRRSDGLPNTDWDNALRIGHMMQPPPDVIYFMSDGQDSQLDIDRIIENNRKRGEPKINCLAMQTGFGAAQFSEISKRSKGAFVIIDKRGKPIAGDEYLLDPNQYSSRF